MCNGTELKSMQGIPPSRPVDCWCAISPPRPHPQQHLHPAITQGGVRSSELSQRTASVQDLFLLGLADAAAHLSALLAVVLFIVIVFLFFFCTVCTDAHARKPNQARSNLTQNLAMLQCPMLRPICEKSSTLTNSPLLALQIFKLLDHRCKV